MILDMEGILLGGGRADKGINKNQKNIDLKTHIVTYIPFVQEVVTPIYIMTYYIKWVTTSWTYGSFEDRAIFHEFIYQSVMGK